MGAAGSSRIGEAREGSVGKRQRRWRRGRRRLRRSGRSVAAERSKHHAREVARRRDWSGKVSRQRMTVATSSGSPGISDAAAKAELVREARVPALRPESEEDDEAISVPSWPRRGIDSTRGLKSLPFQSRSARAHDSAPSPSNPLTVFFV